MKPEQPSREDGVYGIGILDVVLAAIRSWKAILLSGLVFGLLGWGVAQAFYAPYYEIRADLRLSQNELRPFVARSAASEANQMAREGIYWGGTGAECFTTGSVATCSSVILVHAETPERAQAVLSDVLGRIEGQYSADGARSQAAGMAQSEVDIQSQTLQGLQRVLTRLESEIAADGSTQPAIDVSDYANAILVLERGMGDLRQRLLTAQNRADAYQNNILVREPPPATRIRGRPEMTGLLVGIGAMLIVLNLAVLRIYLSRQDPQSNVMLKIGLVRDALRRPRP